MPDIRYVCLSDMHLGEEDSLLTNVKVVGSTPDLTRPSLVLICLVDCLKALISKNEGSEKPALVLNGDILELALAFTNQAAMAFERFIELLKTPEGDPLFSHVIYIPGNHDHHIWEVARETQYVHYIRGVNPGQPLGPTRHTTDMFFESYDGMVSSYFLSNLVMRYQHLSKTEILVAYPNFGIVSPGGSRCVLFHHGHYVESIYQLVSMLRSLLLGTDPPDGIEEIEAENFAWIDFFWSALGRSGKAGETVESIYERMLSVAHFKKMLSRFAEKIAKKYDLPGWGDWMETRLLERILRSFGEGILRRERRETSLPMSEDAEKGLWKYVQGPLLKQLKGDLGGGVPSQVSFVFGHTHKPFQEDLHFDGYPEWVDVYNTGGWVVDSVYREPVHGASVVLVDEDLNLTSLRMYNEAEDMNDYKVQVREATHAGEAENRFHDRIQKLVAEEPKPFEDFSEAVARDVYIRAQKLRYRLLKLE